MRNKRVTIRIDEIEYNEMTHDAQKLKRSISEYLRYLHKKFGHTIAEEFRVNDRNNHEEYAITKEKILQWVKEGKQ